MRFVENATKLFVGDNKQNWEVQRYFFLEKLSFLELLAKNSNH